jgi:hypothetical protein
MIEGSSFESTYQAQWPKTRESNPLKVDKKRKIGGGEMGLVYEVEVTVGVKEDASNQAEHSGNIKKRTFALKEFHDGADGDFVYDPAEDRAVRAMKNFSELKNAGLATWETYRLGEDGKSILMTYGEMEEWRCVGSNEDETGTEKMPEIENLDWLLEKMLSQVNIANNKNIHFPTDAYFFLVQKESNKKMDVLIGDLDLVVSNLNEDGSLVRDEAAFLKSNFEAAKSALNLFIKNSIADSALKDKYTKQVEAYFDSGLNNQFH